MSSATDFKHDATRITRDLRHRALIQKALKNYEVGRDAKKSKFQNWEEARQTAAEIKWDAINHLERHLVEFAEKLEARGGKVHWASNADQAREINNSTLLNEIMNAAGRNLLPVHV